MFVICLIDSCFPLTLYSPALILCLMFAVAVDFFSEFSCALVACCAEDCVLFCAADAIVMNSKLDIIIVLNNNVLFFMFCLNFYSI